MRADELVKNLYFFLFLGERGGGLGGLRLGHALLELIDAAGGIDELLLAGIKGMAGVANTHDNYGFRGAGRDDVAAGATNLGFHIFRMNVCFHKRLEKIAPPSANTRKYCRKRAMTELFHTK
jgi:hypothetical protein